MKKIYSIMASVVLMSAFTACSNDDDMPKVANVNGSELVVKSVGVASIDTKAGITANNFTNGESLGLYIYRGDGINGTSIAPGDETYNDGTGSEFESTVNVPYNEAAGSWSATSQAIILSNVKGKVYAYYPYKENNNAAESGVDNGLAVKVSVATSQGTGQSDGKKDQDQTDYMWADPVSDVSNANSSVDLRMNHALSMITFKFVQTTEDGIKYPGEGMVSKIVLQNQTGGHVVKTGDATMNIATGKLDLGSANDGTITLTPNAGESLMGQGAAAKLPRLLVYPTEANITGTDAAVAVTVDDYTYTVKIPSLLIDDPEDTEAPINKIGSPWLPGKNYVYTLTMKGTGLSITSVTIVPWEDVEGNSGASMEVVDPDPAPIP